MRLHTNQELFEAAIQASAQQKGLPEIYIEKDYWVTVALHTVFSAPIGSEVVFKGGTALSKCYHLIERFSEDIDLVVIRREGESNNALTNKIKKISAIVGGVLPEIEVPGITAKMGMNRKTAHSYQKTFGGSYGQVRDQVIVEATWLGHSEPNTGAEVGSYIGEMMEAAGQQSLMGQYGLHPFPVQVLTRERTLCEKIMSLVRFSYADNPMADLRSKIRHLYDIHQLLQEPELAHFFKSDAFEQLLQQVAGDDVLSFKNNNAWLSNHPGLALLFAQPEKTWKELRGTYRTDFRRLVFGTLPEEAAILFTLLQVADRVKAIAWSIQPPSAP
jgi:hypothetical protein